MARSGKRSDALGLAGMMRESADYRAAKRSTRLRPRPRGIPTQGAAADWHYRGDSDHLWMGELGHEMDRNNVIGQRVLDIQTTNVLQDGFQYDPDTGDDKLNDDLKTWWSELSNDANRIDAQGEFTFSEMTAMVYRAKKAAGDIWGLLRTDGSIELAEFHRVRSPSRSVKENIVLGVELDDYRRRQRAWFTKEPISPLSGAAISKRDLVAFPFFRQGETVDDELPRVVQVYDPKRCTQTRGVTGFAPIFDYLGLHDDLQFLQLVKSQMHSMVLLLRNREVGWDPSKLGGDSSTTAGDTIESTLITEELRPGSQIGGLPGERLELASGNIPNSEFFEHMRLVLSLCGICFYVPLVQLMLDARETNFSGYRGAISEARNFFRRDQTQLELQWHRPVLIWELDRLADEDRAIARARDGRAGRGKKVDLYKHRWKKPRWEYIEPMKDASAALIRTGNMLASPSQQAMQDGQGEWEDIVAETVRDRSQAIRAAVQEAMAINQQFGLQADDAVRWRELAPLPNPERVTLSISEQTTDQSGQNNGQ